MWPLPRQSGYAYAYIVPGSGGGRSLTRTELTWNSGSGLFVNDNKVLYEWNALEWMRKEQRHDWSGGSWVAKYDVNQEYDKRGNRTRYDKNVQGLAADYGISYDLNYTFNGSSMLTAIVDTNAVNYACAVTCDANNNITAIDETVTVAVPPPPKINHIYTYFDVDDLNRVTAQRTKAYVAGGTNAWVWTKRAHEYDGLGRIARSTYKTWLDGSMEPAGTSLEHTFDQQGNFLQNYDGTSTYGAVWHWAGTAMPETRGPLKSPNADTAAQTGYNHADNVTPQRRTFLTPTTEGDQRHEWGQGRPQAKDSSGGGTAWANGVTSAPQAAGMLAVESRLNYEGTVSATVDRGTDAREMGRIGMFGSGFSYAGGYGRVTSESIGRDINPLGRGDGMAYVGGWMNLGLTTPRVPKGHSLFGLGNSINNQVCFPCNPLGGMGAFMPVAAAGGNCGPISDASKAQFPKYSVHVQPSAQDTPANPSNGPEGVLIEEASEPGNPPERELGKQISKRGDLDCFEKAEQRYIRCQNIYQNDRERCLRDYNKEIDEIDKWALEVGGEILSHYFDKAKTYSAFLPEHLDPWAGAPDIDDTRWGPGRFWRQVVGADDFKSAAEQLLGDFVNLVSWLKCQAWNDYAECDNEGQINMCLNYNDYMREINRCQAAAQAAGSPPQTPRKFLNCSPHCLGMLPTLNCGPYPGWTIVGTLFWGVGGSMYLGGPGQLSPWP